MIFQYTDYKKWVNERILSMPKEGWGQYLRISEFLGTSSTAIAQIFKGDRDLAPEQAVSLAEFFGLSKIELQYLLLLVNYSRAGTPRYKKIIAEQIHELQKQAQEIKNRVPQDRELTEEAKAILYSNWYYLAIWSLTAIPGFNNLEVISDRLNISKRKAAQAIEFLIKHSLIKEKNGKYEIGPTLIHLESNSPSIPRHHQNWRNRSFLAHENLGDTEAAYTAPITLSKKDAEIIREKMLKFISEIADVVKDSPSEELYCICLDWFKV